MTGTLSGDVFTWDSPNSGRYDVSTNWSPNGIPGASDSIRFGFTDETTVDPIDVLFDASVTQFASDAEVFAGVYQWSTDGSGAEIFFDGPVVVGSTGAEPPLGLPTTGELRVEGAPMVVRSDGITIGTADRTQVGHLVLNGPSVVWTVDGNLSCLAGDISMSSASTLLIPGEASKVRVAPGPIFQWHNLEADNSSIVAPNTDFLIEDNARIALNDMTAFVCDELFFGPGGNLPETHTITSAGFVRIGSIRGERSLRLDLIGDVIVEGSVVVSAAPNASTELRLGDGVQMESLTIGQGELGGGFVVCSPPVVIQNEVVLHNAARLAGGGLTIGSGDPAVTGDEIRLTDGGVLSGLGSVSRLVLDGGELRPGLPYGIMTSTRSFELRSGALRVDLGADRLIVDGDASLGGSLIADLIPGLTLQPGIDIEVVTSAGLTGEFESFVNNTPFHLTVIVDDLSAYVRVLCRSDIDGDDEIGMRDLIQLLDSWGSCADGGANPATCPSDISRDATVGLDDLLLLIRDWGACGTV